VKTIRYLLLYIIGLSLTAVKAQDLPPTNPSVTDQSVDSRLIDISPLTGRYSRELFLEKIGALGIYTTSSVAEPIKEIVILAKHEVNINQHVVNQFIEECKLAEETTPDSEKEAYLNNRQTPNGREPKMPCQSVKLYFDTANCIPQPETVGSYTYFNLCQDDTIHFAVEGVYNQNGTNYTQQDTLHKYSWVFGDGANVITHFEPFSDKFYGEAKGYEMVVTMTDTNNCPSNPLSARVRIAGNPIQSITRPDPICFDATKPGDTIQINLTTLAAVVPFQYALVSSQRYDSITFIPDGPNCPQLGLCYNTPVTFTSFTPGQTLTSPSDLLSVCVTMEHTYLSDINITIICPNGQQAVLHQNSGGGSWLGEAIDDSGGNVCDPKQNPPGTPYNYCWTEYYPTSTTLANGPSHNWNGANVKDSSNRINHTNYFSPQSSLTSLIGCPLNGEWNIQVCDIVGVDNGYIFSWELNLDPALLPQNWQYSVSNDTTYLEGPGVVGQNKSNALVVPTAPGLFEYTYKVQDEYGCTFDTTISIEVIAVPDPSLGPDTHACQGETITLGNTNCTNCIYTWSTNDKTPTIDVHTTGAYWREVTSPENCTASDTIQAIFHAPPPPILIKHL